MRELLISYSKKALRVSREEGIASLLKVATINAIQLISFPLFSRRMQSVTRDSGLEEVVDFAFKEASLSSDRFRSEAKF
jgi:hypothetical protein